MITDERLLNVVVAEKLLRVPGVFAGNLVDFFQDAERAQGNVLKVADGRGNEVKSYLTAAGLLHPSSLACAFADSVRAILRSSRQNWREQQCHCTSTNV